MHYNKENFSARLKEAIKKEGLSQQEFADKSNVPLNTIKGHLKEGKQKRYPSLDVLISYCNALDCEMDYLLGAIDEKTRIKTDVCKETGLSEDALKKIDEWNQVNSTDYLNKLVVNGYDFMLNYQIYFARAETVKLHKEIQKIPKKYSKVISLGKIAFESTMSSSDLGTKALFDDFKKRVGNYVVLDEKILSTLFEYYMDEYQLDRLQQRCLKELTLFLESLK